MHPIRKMLSLAAIFFALIGAAVPLAGQVKGGWLPITPEDLALKEIPGVPGAHAVLLYRETFADDEASVESNYYRIKILTEEGKKFGDVEIPYRKGRISVGDIKARTIRPDGTVVEFDGKVFDKTVVKARGIKIQEKAFTMPEVLVGGLIEFKFKVRWDESSFYSPFWSLQHELFTRHAKFSFKPYLRPGINIKWININVPGNQMAREQKGGLIGMELENVPALVEEDYMPPKSAVEMRVEFFYSLERLETPDEFWKREGKEWYDAVESYIGKRGGIAKTSVEITAGADSPEAKLKKIYARVQQIRNLSYEREKTEKEEKREKLKDNNNIEDVLKNGYGYRSQINRLFIGLARATGLEATAVRISERDTYFFHKNLQDPNQLDGEVSLVRVGNDERYFDPGTPNCPFGLLSWEKTGVQGIRLGKDGGMFVTTTQPVSTDARTERKASLRLLEDGTLQGKVHYTFHGQPALNRRQDAMDTDEMGRQKDLEEEVKNALPSGAKVKLEKATGWEGFDVPLEVEFSVEIPGYATSTGRRLLMPAAVFQSGRKHPFQHAERKFPVYFNNPWQETDEVTVELPAGFRIESLPTPRRTGIQSVSTYEIFRENKEGKLQVRRRLTMEGFYFPPEYYPVMRQFYDRVRAGDEEQVVLQTSESSPRN